MPIGARTSPRRLAIGAEDLDLAADIAQSASGHVHWAPDGGLRARAAGERRRQRHASHARGARRGPARPCRRPWPACRFATRPLHHAGSGTARGPCADGHGVAQSTSTEGGGPPAGPSGMQTVLTRRPPPCQAGTQAACARTTSRTGNYLHIVNNDRCWQQHHCICYNICLIVIIGARIQRIAYIIGADDRKP